MGEVIQFPTPDVHNNGTYVVKDGPNDCEVCWTNTQHSARNIARILAKEWPGCRYTVETSDGEEIFEITEEDFSE